MITKMAIYFLSFFLNIQVEMADAFRSDGKIYVVVLVALIILVGIIFYLFRIEGKIKDINKNKSKIYFLYILFFFQ